MPNPQNSAKEDNLLVARSHLFPRDPTYRNVGSSRNIAFLFVSSSGRPGIPGRNERVKSIIEMFQKSRAKDKCYNVKSRIYPSGRDAQNEGETRLAVTAAGTRERLSAFIRSCPPSPACSHAHVGKLCMQRVPESDLERIYPQGRDAFGRPYPVGPNSENKPIGQVPTLRIYLQSRYITYPFFSPKKKRIYLCIGIC